MDQALTAHGIRREWWGPHSWKDYALRVWKGLGRVEEIKGDSKERLEFVERAKRSFIENDVPVKRIRTWVNVMPPSDEKGYDKGYPHVHHDDTATTLVHYMDCGDKPPNLDIFIGDEVFSLTPQAGETIYIPNGIKHGVHRNNGSTPRVAFIATAYRR